MMRQINNPLEATPPTNFNPTVTLVGGSGNTVPQYIVNSGRYVRVGKKVFLDILLSGDGGNEGAGTGQINIALPIVASSSQLSNQFVAGSVQNSAGTPSGYVVNAKIAPSASTVSLSKTGLTDVQGVDQAGTTRFIRLSFSYEVN